MNEFVASNGVKIEVKPSSFDGLMYLTGSKYRGTGCPEATGSNQGIDALREFFLAERDAELGRWRSKEHPEYVVHEHGDGRVRVMRELDGSSYSFDRESVHRFYPHCDAEVDFQRIAREFFAAHPEPKPWHDAQPGEVWLVTLDGKPSVPMTLEIDTDGEPAFFYGAEAWDVASASITAGRRIWPEVQS